MKAARTTRLRPICRTFVISLSSVGTTGIGSLTARNTRSAIWRFEMRRRYRYERLRYCRRMTFERDEDLVEKLVDRQVVPGGTYLTFARDTIADSGRCPNDTATSFFTRAR